MKIFFSSLLVVVFALPVLAYVPPFQFIASRVAKNHGRNSYVIEQEVTITSGNETVTGVERWTVEDGATMQLSLKGALGRGLIVYQKGTKFWKEAQGGMRSEAQPKEFTEPFFHIRTATGLTDQIVTAAILSRSQFSTAKKPIRSLKDTQYTPETYLRLGRTSGVIAYALGQPTPVNAPKPFPGLWIEQDRFHIRKIRFPTSAEVVAEEYSDFAYDLAFPRQRTITWDGKTARIQVLKVTAVGKSTISNQNLNAKDVAVEWPETLATAAIQEFYRRFR
jgi:hypothetical protein